MEWIKINERSPIVELEKRGASTKLFEIKFTDGSVGKILYGNSGFQGEGNGWFSHGCPIFTHWRNIEEEKD
jgi:hypothetical protein